MRKRQLTMKHFSLFLFVLIFFVGCTKEEAITNSLVETNPVSNISGKGAASGGNVIDDGNSIVTQRGVCWNDKGSPTLKDFKTEDGSGVGSFTSTLTNLNPNTRYYIRAYSTNSNGTSYGEIVEFKTLPTELEITTNEVTYITPISAVSGGTVSSPDNLFIDQKGICWNTSGNPTVSDYKTLDGDSSGTYISSISGTSPTSNWLEQQTKYYVRAYAICGNKVFYGNVVSFTTSLGTPNITDFEGNVYRTVKIGNQIWMAENLKTKFYKNGGVIEKVEPKYGYTKANKGVYCNYDNKPDNSIFYGYMYNFPAISNPEGICPEGWHLPTFNDMYTMINELGGPFVAYPKLKEVGQSHWIGNNFATNESGFTGLPGGMFFSDGVFAYLGYFCSGWWTADISPLTQTALLMYLYNTSIEAYFHSSFGKDKEYFNYVRCVKDNTVL